MKQRAIQKHLQRVALQSQGLSKTQPFGKGKKAVLAALEHLGYVQIDTLAVVERAHHHILWSRVPDYRVEYLDRLVAERKVFEFWFHAASFLPMRDFRFALPKMLQYKRGEAPFYSGLDPKILEHVKDRIRIDGPQKARDFESPGKKSGSWWDWKPAKKALEKLFMQGDLMVSRREGMEKVYDLTERVLPASVDTTEPSPVEYAEYLVKTHLRAYGITTQKQIVHEKKGMTLRKNVAHVLHSMVEARTIQAIHAAGMPTFFADPEVIDSQVRKPLPDIRLLSPFDNSVIHRERLALLFDFDFRLECYTPKEKRQYGYFCIPILFGDEFLGRVDCKAHRKIGLLELIHLHIENKALNVYRWLDAWVIALRRFAEFNGCHSIQLTRVSPKALTNTLQSAIDS